MDVESKLIVEHHLTQHVNDKQELVPALERLKALPDELGTVQTVLADSGYYSESNVKACESMGVQPFINLGRERHNLPLCVGNAELEPLPDDADAVTEMEHRLRSREGRIVYGKRKSTSEPVFGIVKAVMGFRQFLLRGVEAVAGEWGLVCIAFNLRRIFTLSLAKAAA